MSANLEFVSSVRWASLLYTLVFNLPLDQVLFEQYDYRYITPNLEVLCRKSRTTLVTCVERLSYVCIIYCCTGGGYCHGRCAEGASESVKKCPSLAL